MLKITEYVEKELEDDWVMLEKKKSFSENENE